MNVEKNLGVVTAYGSAIQGGYIGTPEEFYETLGNLPQLTSRAEEAAIKAEEDLQTILDAKDAVETAAQNASDSATTATTKAAEAVQAKEAAEAAAASFSVDTTLSESGKPADAAATGTAITTIQNNLTQTQNDLSQAETNITQLGTDVTELQSDVTQAETNITQLQTNLTQAQTNITQMGADINQLEADVAEISEHGISAVGATAGQVPVADGNGSWAWGDQTGGGGSSSGGGIRTVLNTAELAKTTEDYVLVLNNDSYYGNGGACIFYNQGSAREWSGVQREDGTYVYPMASSQKPPATTPPVKELMAIIKSWIGRDNIIHKDGSVLDLTGLFGTDCKADSNGKYHMDCSDFIVAILRGITYERSKYVLGNDAENREEWQMTVGVMPTSTNREKINGGLGAGELAMWFANQGRLFSCGTDAEKLANTLQFGDILFGSNESHNPKNYFAIEHVMFVLGTVIDNGTPRAVIAQCNSDPTYAQEPVVNHIRLFQLVDDSSYLKVFARPAYKTSGLSADSIIPKQTGYGYDLTWLPCAEVLLDDQTQQTVNRKRGEVHASGLFATTTNYIPVTPASHVLYTGNASSSKGNYYVRVHEYDKYLNPVKRGSTIAYNGSAVSAGVTLDSATRFIKFAIGLGSSGGNKIWLSDTDDFDVTITPPTQS